MEKQAEVKNERLEAFRKQIENEGGFIVSSATLRTMDLIEATMGIIDGVVPEQAKKLRAEYAGVFQYMESSGDTWLSKDAWFEEASEEIADLASWLLNETIFDIMCDIAPQAYGYGTQEGDGACFGFWLDERIASAAYAIDEHELSDNDAWELLQETDLDISDIAAQIRERLKGACYADYDFAERVANAARR
jgi:hypothetical protein